MKQLNREKVIRLALTLMVLLSGLALIPFVDQPVTAIGWKLFAGIYTPVLAVNETAGAPGSVFAFTGTNYPPNSLATIYINGQGRGTVMTNPAGAASFHVNTLGAAIGRYDVTLEVGINASATNGFDLDDGEPLVTPPPGDGPVVFVQNVVFLPAVQK